MLSSSPFSWSKALLRSPLAIGVGSTALLLGFTAPSEAVMFSCAEGGDFGGTSIPNTSSAPNCDPLASISSPGLRPSSTPGGSDGDQITVTGDVDSALDLDIFSFSVDGPFDTISWKASSEMNAEFGSFIVDLYGPGAVALDTIVLGPPLPADVGPNILNGDFGAGIYSIRFFAGGGTPVMSDYEATFTPSVTPPLVPSFTPLNGSTEVPGPLPVMGACVAFGFTRKLRGRIYTSSRSA